MKKVKARIFAVVTMVSLLASVGVADAAVEYPKEGGKWEYGTDGPSIWSNYYHKTRSHGSSVRNCHGDLTRSPVVNPGQWSNASRGDGCKRGVDQAYYRVV